jgi:hypothetical protein
MLICFWESSFLLHTPAPLQPRIIMLNLLLKKFFPATYPCPLFSPWLPCWFCWWERSLLLHNPAPSSAPIYHVDSAIEKVLPCYIPLPPLLPLITMLIRRSRFLKVDNWYENLGCGSNPKTLLLNTFSKFAAVFCGNENLCLYRDQKVIIYIWKFFVLN